MNIVRLSCIHFCQLFVCTNRVVFIIIALSVCVWVCFFINALILCMFLFDFCKSILIFVAHFLWQRHYFLFRTKNQFVNVSAVVFSLCLSLSFCLQCVLFGWFANLWRQESDRATTASHTEATEQSAKRHNWFNFIIKYHAIYELHINI